MDSKLKQQKQSTIKYRRIAVSLQSAFAQFSAPLANVLLSIFIIRFYTPIYWGNYISVLLVIQFFLLLINLGSKDLLIRQFSQQPAQTREWFLISIQVKGLLALFVLPFAFLFHYPLWIIGWTLARMASQCFEPINIFRKFFLVPAILELFLTAAIIAGAYWQRWSLESFLLAGIMADLFRAGAYFILHYDLFSFSKKIALSMADFLKASLPFLGLSIAGFLASRGELYMMGYFSDKAKLAHYQIINQFTQYGHILATSLVLPMVKTLYRVPADTFKHLEVRFIQLGLVLSLLIALGIGWITRYIFLFSMPWQFLLLVYINLLTYYFYFFKIQGNFIHHRTSQNILFISVMGLTNLGIGVLFIPKMDLLGALIAANISSLVGVACFRISDVINVNK